MSSILPVLAIGIPTFFILLFKWCYRQQHISYYDNYTIQEIRQHRAHCEAKRHEAEQFEQQSKDLKDFKNQSHWKAMRLYYTYERKALDGILKRRGVAH